MIPGRALAHATGAHLAGQPTPGVALTRILIAEDNDLNRRLYSDLLTMKGYEVTAVADGQDALRLAMEDPPELILLDIQLPGCSGHEAIRRLRDNPDFADLPVIAVSAFAHRNDRDRAMENGFTDYITKPASVDDILSTVNRYLPDTAAAG